uniref:Uncharacterized protein n=1 Tax=Panagrolaimus sp. PS1159 TaxID=55785 RepID=A0AC35EZZ8_9BILA
MIFESRSSTSSPCNEIEQSAKFVVEEKEIFGEDDNNGMPHGFAPRYFDYHHHHQQQQQQQHPSQQPPQPKGNGSTSTVSSPSPMSNNSSIGSIQQQQQQAQQQQHQNGINLSLQNGASTNSNGIEPSNIKEEANNQFNPNLMNNCFPCPSIRLPPSCPSAASTTTTATMQPGN